MVEQSTKGKKSTRVPDKSFNQMEIQPQSGPLVGGRQFERLIGLFKRDFYKTIGNGNLKREELSEVILDIEVALNNRPLMYLEDDIELPVLTPNTMLNINPSVLPEMGTHLIDEKDLRKRAKFLKKCKETMWRRWSREYIRSLRERHRQVSQKNTSHPKAGDAVIIQDEKKNRNLWKLGIVVELIRGRDGVVRAAKVRTTNGCLDRAIQHLFPMELSCDKVEPKKLDPTAPAFEPRPRRDAAAAANVRIQLTAREEEEEN
ncbi:uncharacterized protein LOC114521012 [Dendronephthya gigantea]|uniref:uncharacterized protein LOC114521012 n=1 Tax=Dendronephthya gigantea TaxID=151771 RepID=UPI00106C771B|nr:uncharacterized protein LOC114521012 [Dendronephthya gigantea]